MNGINCNSFGYNFFPIESIEKEDYLFNRKIEEIEELDGLVLVGFNPKLESPVLNSRIL